jgi:hypothetical protein
VLRFEVSSLKKVKIKIACFCSCGGGKNGPLSRLLVARQRIRHAKTVIRHVYFLQWKKEGHICSTKSNTMNKAAFLLLLLAVVTAFTFFLAVKNEKIELSAPMLAGSPIIVLNR